MIDFFRDILSEWPGRIILATLLALLIVLGVGFYYEVDSWSLHRGTVIDKRHQAMWVQFVSTGKTTSTIVYPESWSIEIKGRDDKGVEKTRSVSLDRYEWEKVETGQMFEVKE